MEERPQEVGSRVRRPPLGAEAWEGLTNVVTQCHQHALLYKADDDKLFEQ